MLYQHVLDAVFSDQVRLAANVELVLESAQGDVVQSLVIHGGYPGGA